MLRKCISKIYKMRKLLIVVSLFILIIISLYIIYLQATNNYDDIAPPFRPDLTSEPFFKIYGNLTGSYDPVNASITNIIVPISINNSTPINLSNVRIEIYSEHDPYDMFYLNDEKKCTITWIKSNEQTPDTFIEENESILLNLLLLQRKKITVPSNINIDFYLPDRGTWELYVNISSVSGQVAYLNYEISPAGIPYSS